MGMTCQSSSGAVRGCQRRCPSCSRQGNLPAGRRVPLRSSACPSACLPAWPNVDACFFATLAGLCCCCSLQVLKLESRKPRPERGLTVVTQLSLERFQMLENQCGTWPFQVGGPTEGRGVGYGVGLVLMLAAASVCLPACPPCLPARTDLCRAFHPPFLLLSYLAATCLAPAHLPLLNRRSLRCSTSHCLRVAPSPEPSHTPPLPAPAPALPLVNRRSLRCSTSRCSRGASSRLKSRCGIDAPWMWGWQR